MLTSLRVLGPKILRTTGLVFMRVSRGAGRLRARGLRSARPKAAVLKVFHPDGHGRSTLAGQRGGVRQPMPGCALLRDSKNPTTCGITRR